MIQKKKMKKRKIIQITVYKQMKIIFVYKKINKNKSLNPSHSQRNNNYFMIYMILQ